jgi:hypothetical protein
MAVEDPITASIVAFIESVGIPVTLEKTPEDTFLPGVLIRSGGLVFDPATLPYPGDLLHEAGHIAVTDPAQRPTLDDVPNNPAEEMTAMAWSYAAARAMGIDPAIVFHPDGYKGSSESLLAGYNASTGPGIPMLAYFGMSAEPLRAAELGREPYPAMTRWLR